MSSQEEVERKVNTEAEGDQLDPEELPPAEGSDTTGEGSAVGDLLMGASVGWATVAPLSLAVLLFGGLLSVAVGATLWVSRYGFEATLTFAGVWAVVVAYVLAQVYARRGWI